MKILNIGLALFAVAVFLPSQLNAQEDLSLEAIETNIILSLRSARPDLVYGEFAPSPIEGYYRVIASGGTILYVSEDGKHFFAGELYHVEPGQFVNATEVERAVERANLVAAVGLDTMIVFPAVGEAKGVLNVFTDVTCGYCRKLHEQMAEMNTAGIEVRYLAYPRSGIERDGVLTQEYTETAKAWCSEDPNETMTQLKAGQPVSGELCSDSPVADHYALGRLFGVTGTPAIVLEDGTLHPGYRTTDGFLQLLGISE